MLLISTIERIYKTVAAYDKQPLPWEVFGEFKFKSNESEERVYDAIKKAVMDADFDEYQKLDQEEYATILNALKMQRMKIQTAFQKVQDVNPPLAREYFNDRLNLDRLIEKVEVVQHNANRG